MTTIKITFNTHYTLDFTLTESEISERWLTVLKDAIKNYSIDDPMRFYGFSSNADIALQKINTTIDTINNHKPLIDRNVLSVHDYDTLNYLHSIFEKHHGLSDAQTNEFKSMPEEYQKALCQLNIDVHRCESVLRGNKPRVVVTYFEQPKTEKFNDADFDLMTNRYEFGTVYLNYVNIGKTLEDLAQDNDEYISREAFKPFINFSSDFNIKFWDTDVPKAKIVEKMMDEYYIEHQEFFNSLGYERNHPYLKPGSIPVAKLSSSEDRESIINNIKNNQLITKILIE
jgi:hypothetical protein